MTPHRSLSPGPAGTWVTQTKPPPSGDCRDLDKDGYFAGPNCPQANDCDDNDKDINPGIAEVFSRPQATA